MNEIVMWVSNLLSFFAIVVAAGVLIWQTDKQHKNNIKLTAIAKLQRELDAVKKLRQMIGSHSKTTSEDVIPLIRKCITPNPEPAINPKIFELFGEAYKSMWAMTSTVFSDLRDVDTSIFINFLGMAFTTEVAVLETKTIILERGKLGAVNVEERNRKLTKNLETLVQLCRNCDKLIKCENAKCIESAISELNAEIAKLKSQK